MRKFLLCLIAVLLFGGAYATGDATITSKQYVNAQIATKQDKVPGVDTNTVLKYTDVSGEIGQKAIYDPTGSYAAQQEALVTAEVANTAVQNAIDTEIVCTEWAPGADQTNENCYIWNVKNAVNQSKNLFNISKIPSYGSMTNTNSAILINNGNGTLTLRGTSSNSAVDTNTRLSRLAPDLIVGNTYTLSFKSTSSIKGWTLRLPDGMWGYWAANTSKTITQEMLDAVVNFQSEARSNPPINTISNIQIEPGTIATPYQPYNQNTYLPQGQ